MFLSLLYLHVKRGVGHRREDAEDFVFVLDG